MLQGCPVPFPVGWDHGEPPHPPALGSGHLNSSSHLQGKCLTRWAISPAPFLFFFEWSVFLVPMVFKICAFLSNDARFYFNKNISQMCSTSKTSIFLLTENRQRRACVHLVTLHLGFWKCTHPGSWPPRDICGHLVIQWPLTGCTVCINPLAGSGNPSWAKPTAESSRACSPC